MNHTLTNDELQRAINDAGRMLTGPGKTYCANQINEIHRHRLLRAKIGVPVLIPTVPTRSQEQQESNSSPFPGTDGN